ncbi:uncharacterized protein Fot_30503 [Forsythia ovata]|uniref:Uncharacterized protein n=1 Tax=Forsythia ovata TaxID=205694 RepID=A0ABD1TUY1_9LAMI
MVETSSSFGSSSSSPSMSNMPPNKIRIESGNGKFHDQMVLIGRIVLTSPPTYFGGVATVPLIVGVNTVTVTSKHLSRVIFDNQKSDHGAPTRLRKPPFPLQPVQRKLVDVDNLPSPDLKHAEGYSLPKPNSVARYLIPDQIFSLDSTIFLCLINYISHKYYRGIPGGWETLQDFTAINGGI